MDSVPTRAQIANAIRTVRAAAAESQTKAASFLGVTQASLSNYENGKRDVPGFLLLAVASRYTRGDVNALIEVALGSHSASSAVKGS